MTRTLAVALALIAAPVSAQTIAITNGTVAKGDGSAPIEGATVVIRDGRIVAAGSSVAVPANAQVIDAAGKWVAPGMVAGFSRVALVEVNAVEQTDDSDGGSAIFNAGLDVSTALNPKSATVSVSRAGGVTRALVAPAVGTSIFAGQGAIIDLGDDWNPVTRARAFQFVELGEAAAAKAGGSRMGTHAWFRNALRQAQVYARNPAGYDGQSSDDLLKKVDAEALAKVVQGQVPLLVHVEQARDILATLALQQEFPALRLVLVGATEGWTVAHEIAAAKVPVIASALNDLPAAFEQLAATQSNIGRMKAAGVDVAIGMIDDRDSHQLRYSPQYAGNLVALGKLPGAAGLSWADAFAAITSKPAEIMGVGNEIGSLLPGRRADIVIWSGDPLELSSTPEAVFIDGIRQPIETRQTRLRDRYRTPQEGDLPKAYER